MNRFLAGITADKRDEVAAAKAGLSEAELSARLGDLPACRRFGQALTGPGTRIIAEVKRRSPSVPAFLQQGAPADLAAVYGAAGASALSLVVDEARFGTSPTDIQPMKAAVDLPLIAKEFIVDPYQVKALRLAGADAVLLIARLLDGPHLAELHALAVGLGLDVLVECHDLADVERALFAEATLVGINNRDLDTFTVTLDTSRDLLGRIPSTCRRVVESGVGRRDEITELEALGADAFLIGGSLLQDSDPAARLRSYLGTDEATP